MTEAVTPTGTALTTDKLIDSGGLMMLSDGDFIWNILAGFVVIGAMTVGAGTLAFVAWVVYALFL